MSLFNSREENANTIYLRNLEQVTTGPDALDLTNDVFEGDGIHQKLNHFTTSTCKIIRLVTILGYIITAILATLTNSDFSIIEMYYVIAIEVCGLKVYELFVTVTYPVRDANWSRVSFAIYISLLYFFALVYFMHLLSIYVLDIFLKFHTYY